MKNIFDILIHLEESCAKILISKKVKDRIAFVNVTNIDPDFRHTLNVRGTLFLYTEDQGLIDVHDTGRFTIGLQNDGNTHFNTFSLDEVSPEERIEFLNLFTKCMENKKKWTLYMVYPQTYNEVQIEKV